MHADELIEAGTSMIVVLPMSTQVRPGISHLRTTVPARDRLLKDCQVLADQPRGLDRTRFGEGPLTKLTDGELARVEATLLAVLGMFSPERASPHL